jgi:hypothetical protein
MNKRVLTIAILTMFVLSVHCAMNVRHENNLRTDENTVTATGTIAFMRLEGGFFGIITDDGEKYLPINLPEEYQKDGLKVTFEGRLRPDISGIHMWGKYIELIRIDESK